MGILSLITDFIEEKKVQFEYGELHSVSLYKLYCASRNMGNVRARALEFRENANKERFVDGMVPFEDTVDGFLDVLSTKHTPANLFVEWMTVLDKDTALGCKDSSVAWFRKMELRGYSKYKLLWAVEFWADSEVVDQRFAFLYGNCTHREYEDLDRCPDENTYCTESVYDGMVDYVNELSQGYFRSLIRWLCRERNSRLEQLDQ
ncbi:hypothetical protein BJ508DRAFT_337740 [Ascobolus immersus RN42]|uniref:Uncharacterized protein n=1 Tax=Ascobolus immersus RN42 TaxID=1160509 RepID=A0A3N4HTS0_ASCIM|nr:hypothetical protein BJ508DRAFT_337740 [Ascobolus immersus RN42]